MRGLVKGGEKRAPDGGSGTCKGPEVVDAFAELKDRKAARVASPLLQALPRSFSRHVSPLAPGRALGLRFLLPPSVPRLRLSTQGSSKLLPRWEGAFSKPLRTPRPCLGLDQSMQWAQGQAGAVGGRSPSCFHLRARSLSSDLLFLDRVLDRGQRTKVQERTPINLHGIKAQAKRRGVRYSTDPPSRPSAEDSLGPAGRGQAEKTEEPGRGADRTGLENPTAAEPAPEGRGLLGVTQHVGPEPDSNPGLLTRFCGGPGHLLGADPARGMSDRRGNVWVWDGTPGRRRERGPAGWPWASPDRTPLRLRCPLCKNVGRL